MRELVKEILAQYAVYGAAQKYSLSSFSVPQTHIGLKQAKLFCFIIHFNPNAWQITETPSKETLIGMMALRFVVSSMIRLVMGVRTQCSWLNLGTAFKLLYAEQLAKK